MKNAQSGRLGVLVFAGLVVLAACAPAGKPADESMFTADLTGLELRTNELPSLVYVRPGAPSLAAYKGFIIDTVQVNYTDPNMREIDPKDIGRLQESFRTKMVNELKAAGYTVGTRAEAGKLRISFVIGGLKAPSAVSNVTTAVFPYALSVGEVTIEAIFRDAKTNQIEAVALQRVQGSRVLNPTPWSSFADVEKTFDVWTRGIREAIDEAHAG